MEKICTKIMYTNAMKSGQNQILKKSAIPKTLGKRNDQINI